MPRPHFRFPNPDEFQPSEQELEDARTSQGAQGTDSAIGGTIGGVAGTIAGLAPLLIPGAGVPIATLTAPALGALGSSIGSAIGGGVGGDAANKADERLRTAEAERQKKLTALQLRQQALDSFLGA